MTSSENEKVKRLQKRLHWLRTRIYTKAKDAADLSYDHAEASALEWAIEIIEVHLKVKEPECKHLFALQQSLTGITQGSAIVFCQRCLVQREI